MKKKWSDNDDDDDLKIQQQKWGNYATTNRETATLGDTNVQWMTGGLG